MKLVTIYKMFKTQFFFWEIINPKIKNIKYMYIYV